MKKYWVYILQCADNSYYTGVTGDLEQRMIDHASGRYPESYTHKRRPVKLVFQTEFNEIHQAIAFEKQVKGWSRKKKQAIIQGKWEDLPSLSECKNKTHFSNKDQNQKGPDDPGEGNL